MTHLIIDPEHPLAEEVQEYNKQRTRRLVLQQQGGFASLMGDLGTHKRKKRRKGGFG